MSHLPVCPSQCGVAAPKLDPEENFSFSCQQPLQGLPALIPEGRAQVPAAARAHGPAQPGRTKCLERKTSRGLIIFCSHRRAGVWQAGHEGREPLPGEDPHPQGSAMMNGLQSWLGKQRRLRKAVNHPPVSLCFHWSAFPSGKTWQFL